jgi:hypothetical protein
MKGAKAKRLLVRNFQDAMATLDKAQQRAAELDAVSRSGEYEDQALLRLHHSLVQVDYARQALDIAEFDELFDFEIGHVLDQHPSPRPLNEAVKQVGDMLVARGYSFRIEY